MLRQKASLALRWSGGIELCRIQRIVLPGALRVRRQRRLRGRTRRQHQHSVPRRQLALRHRRVETQASSPMSRRPRMHRRMETPKDGVAGFRIRVRGADQPTSRHNCVCRTVLRVSSATPAQKRQEPQRPSHRRSDYLGFVPLHLNTIASERTQLVPTAVLTASSSGTARSTVY